MEQLCSFCSPVVMLQGALCYGIEFAHKNSYFFVHDF